MSILSSLPLTNIELWAKLARAAAAVSSWPLALECAKAAVGALPEGQIASLKEPSDAPEISANVWFWLAIAEQVYGQVRRGWWMVGVGGLGGGQTEVAQVYGQVRQGWWWWEWGGGGCRGRGDGSGAGVWTGEERLVGLWVTSTIIFT